MDTAIFSHRLGPRGQKKIIIICVRVAPNRVSRHRRPGHSQKKLRIISEPRHQTTLRDGKGADFNGGLSTRKMFMLNLAGKFTLFVPTDLAFNQFLQKLGGIKEVKYCKNLN